MALAEMIPQNGLDGAALWLVVILSLVQIAPIKINPWTWLAKWAGNAMNGDLVREVRDLREEFDVSLANQARTRILRFNDELLRKDRHSKEMFDSVLEDVDNYERYCTEHPRYYSFLSDRTEMGLGLCCEEAARIILSQTEKFSLFVLDDNGEKDEISSRDERLLILRKNLFTLLQNRKIPLSDRTEHLLTVAGADFPNKSIAEWVDVFSGFEIMNPAWADALSMLSKAETEDAMHEFDTAFENLMIYFIYRHLSAAFDGTDLAARISFAYLGFKIIKALCAAKKSLTGECSFADLCEFARLYSAEIEYSEENTEALIEMLQ